MRLRTAKPAGSDNFVDAELIRPLAWLEESGVVLGESIQFTLPELGLDGPAEILAVEPCPAIEPGRGRVITGTFTTARCQLLEIRLVGLDEVLRPTPPHRIFSLDRSDYVPAEELRAGECLRTQSGRVVMVESIRLQPEPERVYNYEVEGEHHYFVGEYGVLVHNACGPRQSRELTPEDLPNKPPYSPVVEKWVERGGSVGVDERGTWMYSDWEGHTVPYPGGHPDFEGAGLVKATAHFPGQYEGNYTTDYTNADRYSGVTRDPLTETWHHHESLTKMQLINRELHDRFTHIGGVSMIANR